jgi:hypothetical protein
VNITISISVSFVINISFSVTLFLALALLVVLALALTLAEFNFRDDGVILSGDLFWTLYIISVFKNQTCLRNRLP